MSSSSKRWYCTVCGYIHEGPEPPETCPICGVPASEFTEMPAEEPAEAAAEKPATAEAPDASHVRTVSDVMIETMVNWGVTHVFGMVGHSNLGLADAVRRQCEQGKLHYIGIRHEGAAAFAASAFGKLTGRPAACMSIAGPGATNMLTGLWDARMDRVPILALTGQVDTQMLGPGAFQEVNLPAAFESVAEWSQTVLPSSNAVELMNLACKHAILTRNVGHLIFPNEVQTQPADANTVSGSSEGRLPLLDISPPQKAVDAAMALLNRAKRPAIIVGHGARFAMSEITKLAQRLRCPVITTFKAKGLVPDSDPLACGVLGRSGTLISAHFMNNADLLLVFGASFAQHTGINPNIPTVQVDFDPMILGKFHAVTVPVNGEIGLTAKAFLGQLDEAAPCTDQREEIAAKWQAWREEKARRAEKHRGEGLGSAEIFAALGHMIPDDAVIALDVGNNTYSFGRYFECQHQSVLMSGYLGSIGFGFPAAMGAWAAAPERPIIALTGDGGFGQYMAEFCTAVKYKMNITHILLNNQELGKITKEQETEHFPVWETGLHNPDFAKYAEICGGKGIRVQTREQLDAAIPEALAHDGPTLVEIISDPTLV